MIAVQAHDGCPTSPRVRPRLDRAATVGLGVSLALHVGAAAYLAVRQFIVEPPTRVDPPATQVELFRPAPKPPEPKPEPTEPRPNPLRARAVEKVPIAEPVEPSPLPPIDLPPIENPLPPIQTSVDPLPSIDPPLVASDPPPRVIGRPDWLQRPSGKEFARHYPGRALERDVTGRAILNCSVTAAGRLVACVVEEETPPGAGFGAAALKLAPSFQMRPRTEDGQPVDGGQVRIPIAFDLS